MYNYKLSKQMCQWCVIDYKQCDEWKNIFCSHCGIVLGSETIDYNDNSYDKLREKYDDIMLKHLEECKDIDNELDGDYCCECSVTATL